MSSQTDRRARTKARLQQRLRQNQTGGGALSVAETVKLCEEDTRRLNALIADVCSWVSPIDSKIPFLWTDIDIGLTKAVEFMRSLPGASRHMTKQMSLSRHTTMARKRESTAEAEIVLARLKDLIAQLPPDLAVMDPEGLGLRSGRDSHRNARVNVGYGVDPHGSAGFLSAIRAFARLEIALPSELATATGPPRTVRVWKENLDDMEHALLAFKLEQADVKDRQQYNQQRITSATVARLEKWIESARERFTGEGGEAAVVATPR